MDFKTRKAARTKHFLANVKGWKMVVCGACNGSGHYDHNGSPPCSYCNGTGKNQQAPKNQGVS